MYVNDVVKANDICAAAVVYNEVAKAVAAANVNPNYHTFIDTYISHSHYKKS